MNPEKAQENGAQSDRQTKKTIVWTICLVVFMTCLTVCVLALIGKEIPDQLDRLATFALGGVSTMLVKTAGEMISSHASGGNSSTPIPGTDANPIVIKAPEGKPVETQNVTDENFDLGVTAYAPTDTKNGENSP